MPTSLEAPMATGSASLTKRSLARRYAWSIFGVGCSLVLISGLSEAFFGYRDAMRHLSEMQTTQARVAAQEISQYLAFNRRALEQVQALPWGREDFDERRRRTELHRVMTLAPAIIAITDTRMDDGVALEVSRSTPDRNVRVDVAALHDERAGMGPPFFGDDGEPRVNIALVPFDFPGHSTHARVRTEATFHLRFLNDVVSGLRTRDGASAYVLDEGGLLVAHAEPTVTLRQQRVSPQHPALAFRDRPTLSLIESQGINGDTVYTSGVKLSEAPWWVFVEKPRDIMLTPLRESIARSAVLLALGGMASALIGWWLSKRMASPIARMREATSRLARGERSVRLEVSTGDEVQALAEDFNVMTMQLERSYADLESKVIDRTRQLDQQRAEAERANAAKTRFLASASHDLRQPMHAIGLLVDVMRQRAPVGELRNTADKTLQAVQTMESLFAGLLDVSRLDAGIVVPRLEHVSLDTVLEHVRVTHAPLAQAKGLSMRLRASPLVVETDATLLQRTIGNLVANAIRYTERGGVLIVCRRRAGRPLIQVYDTGIGIPSDRIVDVFEEFVRLDYARGDDQGLGLGLSIVKRTVELLGGSVHVVSRVGRGSAFCIELAEGTLRDVNRAATLPEVPLVNRGSMLQGAFIAIVDDDQDNVQAMTSMLEGWGCLTVCASSMEDALQELAKHLRPPDAIVTDLRMQGKACGDLLVAELRRMVGETTPAVIVTADVSYVGNLARCAVLHKPAGAEAIRSALETLLVNSVDEFTGKHPISET